MARDPAGRELVRTKVDVVVVGGGIIGLSVAHAISRSKPALRVVVLEKEESLASHQTGRNSGVIHAGIYYRPGSQKALMVAAGRRALVLFCEENELPYEICGKVIVATDASEMARFDALVERARANGVDVELIGPERLRELEPNASGIAGIHVPSSGVVDFRRVSEALARHLVNSGCEVMLGCRAHSFDRRSGGIVVGTTKGEVEAGWIVNCAGLHADRLDRRLGGDASGLRIIPFRGEYYDLPADRRGLVRNLVYPVPDPRFPFLGVHLTRGIHGAVHAGPNAVLALAREGYSWPTVEGRELVELAMFPGARRLARRWWRTGVGEIYRSLSRGAFLRSVQRLVPAVRSEDLLPAPSGVRAQAVAADGTLVEDFAFSETHRCLSVLNAPSPAATACLEIGAGISRRLFAQMG